ncbi:DUF2157 domain-containing protein [Leptospira kirschneri]|uniref:DUF2157 domain-containing protein n=1 Tax=Leptospira kirschneri TaxID=29507 RepID=UPI0002785162|nr:DUF2157 domain-containing protein [Leptospira kirschneri]EJO70582.1 membrane protein, PF09925 family [Leptospira kirschneri serovar Grippotyphosa str. RM52]EKQ84212.1 membrane protein, PF09925 family [Leptospira kirschneri serovar Grippotyphosa str. Moskva]EMJ98699.1 membrane protein, PF09925 family [Leptospira kirschneri str. MMD1493]OOV50195.1 hypothetical protein B1J94_01485 [Leptospira kirschneri serovar Grippotyphosa]UZW37526.1 DUF2157 domain-containing protein [Leptospira kirschneri]
MRLEQKLKRWVGAGLIASEQSEAILNFEENRKSPYLYYSFLILGVVIIGIGVIAIITANWEEIHDLVKLGFGLTVLVLVAGLGFWKRENLNLLTVFIVLYSILMLGMIGLISQVYNLEGEYYQAAMLWCILSCLFLIATDSKTFLHLWILGFQIFMVGWIQEDDPEHLGQNQSYWTQYLYYSLIGFTGLWLASEKFVLESRKNTLFFWTVIFWIVGTWSMGFFQNLSSFYDGSGTENGIVYQFPWLNIICRLLILIPVFYLLITNSEIDSNQKRSLAIGLVVFFLLCFPHPFRYVYSAEAIGAYIWNYSIQLLPSFLFLLFWLAIASAFRNHKKIFDLSLAIIGIRFLFFYFDLFGSLTYTGFGLIISGLLIILLTIGYLKYRSKVRILLGGGE